MNDRELQNLLPDYLCNRLDEATKTEIEQRLASSEALREALEAAKKYTNSIGALEAVRAPDDFLDKVHHRIRNERGVFERLFRPLHIKLPIELAGVALTVGLVIVLYSPFSGKMPQQLSERSTYSETAPVAPYQTPATPAKASPPTASRKSAGQQSPLPVEDAPASKVVAYSETKKSFPKAMRSTPRAKTQPEENLSTREEAEAPSISSENRIMDDRYAQKEVVSVAPPMTPAEAASVEKPASLEPEASTGMAAASPPSPSADAASGQLAFADEEAPAARMVDGARFAKEKRTSPARSRAVLKSAGFSEKNEAMSLSDRASQPQKPPDESLLKQITEVADRFNGRIESFTNDDENFLQLKIALPAPKYEPFKKALAKKIPAAAIKDTTATSGRRNLMITIEVRR
jgi:hypothetical protein